MADYNEMDKDELLHELNVMSYYRDEMRDTLEKIRLLFTINMDDFPNDWNVNNDEDYGDFIFSKLREYKNNNEDVVNYN
tara:strand:- start:1363 stop:1599 length:237 start_codon:yes stop_codon:yes gene_type:complete